MTDIACQIIESGVVYDNMPLQLRQKISDIVPPHVISRGTKAILAFLGAGPKQTLHYILIC